MTGVVASRARLPGFSAGFAYAQTNRGLSRLACGDHHIGFEVSIGGRKIDQAARCLWFGYRPAVGLELRLVKLADLVYRIGRGQHEEFRAFVRRTPIGGDGPGGACFRVNRQGKVSGNRSFTVSECMRHAARFERNLAATAATRQ